MLLAWARRNPHEARESWAVPRSGRRRRQHSGVGLVDEISIRLVPVLFGSGTRMLEHLGGEHIQFKTVEAIAPRGNTLAVSRRRVTRAREARA